MSIYGSPYDPAWEKGRKDLYMKYYEAKIAAEKLNPEEDYDQERYIALLKEIAGSDLDWWQRQRLINKLDGDNEN